ncbi:DUF4214 domain-containing protein [Methylobacterium nigriterrae]|uniref:DUF4214 domain-containing protein n=1 Tax=Methylobacterium nigriterrae TaxID=3127512 RepID=UPI00301416ED
MAAYALEGPRWGSGPAGTGAVVSWAVDGSVPASFVAEIKAAFADWASRANLTFQQVASTATANIDFSNAYIDGLNNILGQTNYTYSGQSFVSATVTFDSGENWRAVGSDVFSGSGLNLFVVALHEIGHALGLDHYNAAPAVMNAYLNTSVTDLVASDISGIQALYGPPVATATAPTARADGYAAVAGRTLSQAGAGVLANDTASSGAALSVTAVNGAAAKVGQPVAGSYGALTLRSDGSFTYTPGNLAAAPVGSHPVDHFTYAATANGFTATTSLDITLDRLPVAGAVSASAAAGAGLAVGAAQGVLAGASDPDGDALVVSAVGAGSAPGQGVAGQYGTLTLNADGNYGYALTGSAPATGTVVHDVFAFQVSDGRGGTVSSSLDIAVGGPVGTASNSFGTVTHAAASAGGQVYALYDALLGRAPDPLGLEYWASVLGAGTSVKAVAQGFLASPEGQARAGALDNATFVEQLYGTTLHRHSDAAGLSYWTGQLGAGAARADVALGFTFSPEHLSSLQGVLDAGLFVPDANAANVARLYYGILGRAPDAAGLAANTSAVLHGTSLANLAGQFFASSEAQAKFAGVGDAAFVAGLYANALGRTVDAGGLQHWLDALQHGTARADVALAVAESPEAQVHLVGVIESGWHLA